MILIRRLILAIALLAALPLSPLPAQTAARGAINLRSPINWNHPLNRGRVAWWLTVPGYYGGSQWIDLCGLNTGTLTNMGNSSNGWRPQSNPGGYGSVRSDGTAGYTSFADSPSLRLTSQTCGVWFAIISTSDGGIIRKDTQSGNRVLYGIEINRGGKPTGTLTFEYYNSGTGDDVLKTTTSTYNDGNWHFAALTVTPGGVCSLYVDGQFAVTGTSNFALAPATGYGCIGCNPGYVSVPTPANFFAGNISEAFYVNRPWSAAEVYQYFLLSHQSYPGVINRVGSMLPTLADIISGGGAVNFRRTFSPLGTRAGSRQAFLYSPFPWDRSNN